MQENIIHSKEKNQYKKILGAIAKQSHWVFVGKVIFFIFGFTIRILLARILGPAALGRYQLGLTVVEIVSIFSVLGLDRGLIRFLPIIQTKNSSEGRELFTFNFYISFALSIVLAAAIYLLAPLTSSLYFHSEEMTEVLRIFSLYLPVFSLFRVVSGGVNGTKRVDVLSNITNIFCPSAFIILLIVIYFTKATITNCIIARSVTHLIGTIILIYMLLKSLPKEEKTTERDISLSHFLSYSFSLMFIGLIYYLLNHMDIIMLGYFMEESEVGIYSVALRIAIFIIFGLQILLPIVAPHFSELSYSKDFATLEALFKTTTKWIFFSGVSIFYLVSVLRVELLSIFGTEFSGGGNILIVLGIGNLLNALSGPTGQILVMTGKQRWEMYNTIIMIFLNFFLNLFLIPRIGTIGAAIATAISISLMNIAKLIEVYFSYNIHPYNLKYIKIFFSLSCGFIVCYFVRRFSLQAGLGFISIIVISSIVFFICSFICTWLIGLDDDDKEIFKLLRNH